VTSAALNENAVTLRDTFFCENGVWMFAGKPLHDHEPYPTLTVEKIITKSSNIGAAKIALKLGQKDLYRYLTDFGIGTKTGINLRAEEKGLGKKLSEWKPISITRIAMGHEIAVTPLQMTMAMCAIANGGVLMKPMLVDRFENREGQTVINLDPQPVRRVLGEKACRDMIQALKTVVTAEGTAEKAAMEHHIAAGKTGTAEKALNGVYVKGKYFSSFIGFFPADRPELCIAVFLDEPREGYYGGRVAGPIFKQLAEYSANYLNIPPDIQPASATNSPAIHSNRTAAVLHRAASHD
jgi:cell division protein FtsI/penicillin-binding protein 2